MNALNSINWFLTQRPYDDSINAARDKLVIESTTIYNSTSFEVKNVPRIPPPVTAAKPNFMEMAASLEHSLLCRLAEESYHPKNVPMKRLERS